MIRFIKNILDIKNLLGIIRSTIYLHTYGNNVRLRLSCTGLIKISYIESGVTHTDYYTDLQNTDISFTTDAYTTVTIIGYVTALTVLSTGQIDAIDLTRCTSLEVIQAQYLPITEIDISKCKRLKFVNITSNPNLESITIGELPELHTLFLNIQPLLMDIDVSGCPSLQNITAGLTGISEIDLTANPLLHNATFGGSTNLTTIRCLAINQYCANSIATSIQQNSGNAGTVYCNPADPYYSTIATAATNYGWTILPL